MGMIGIPIDLHPAFPETGGDVCILTEGAKHDADIVKKIKARLAAGSNVVIRVCPGDRPATARRQARRRWRQWAAPGTRHAFLDHHPAALVLRVHGAEPMVAQPALGAFPSATDIW